MRPLLFAVSFLFLSGCDPLKIGKAADAIDRFRDTIDKTTKDGGNLDRRLNQISTELHNLVKECKEAGKELTEDFFIKYALARTETIQEILDLTKAIYGDTRILMYEFQGAGLSIPLQLEDSLKGVQGNLKRDLSGLLASANLIYSEKDVPLEYSGVNWSIRPEGYQTVWFSIKDAKSLRLKIGDRVISPDTGPKAGSVTYRIPITPDDDALFDDTRDMGLGFQLVDVTTKQGKDEVKFRYGGTIRLQPRFPVKYEFRVFPTGSDQLGELRTIEQGPAIMNLLSSVSKKDAVITAQRHGDIYREAKSRLAVGASTVVIPRGAHWELKVWFPDGKSEIISPGIPRKENEFGTITVSGPNQKGQEWSLLIDVELNRR